MRPNPFAPAVYLSTLALSHPSPAQDDPAIGAAEFGAHLAAETQTVRNLCAHVFLVTPRVADAIQAEGFGMLSQVPEAMAKELMDHKIRAFLEAVSTTDPEPWCQSTRQRMRDVGGPFAALYSEQHAGVPHLRQPGHHRPARRRPTDLAQVPLAHVSNTPAGGMPGAGRPTAASRSTNPERPQPTP